jgi:hypothetical protein
MTSFRFRWLHRARLYWRTLKFVWQHNRSPSKEEVTEWLLDEMVWPQGPMPTPIVIVGQIPGIAGALTRVEASQSLLDCAMSRHAGPRELEILQRAATRSLATYLALPVGDGRMVLDLVVSGAYIDAVKCPHSERSAALIAAARVELLSTRIPRDDR